MIKKLQFNLVEIALAMAILAIGMSSILVLFPVGVNATKSSVAQNNMSDIAEYITGLYQALLFQQWNNDKGVREMTSLAERPGTNYTSTRAKYEAAIDEGDLEAFSPSNPNYFPNLRHLKNTQGVYIFQQTTGENVDFSAAVMVWWEKITDLYDYWQSSGSVTKYSIPVKGEALAGKSADHDIAIRLYIEVSWPAEIPYENREKQLYIQELSNPKFQITP